MNSRYSFLIATRNRKNNRRFSMLIFSTLLIGNPTTCKVLPQGGQPLIITISDLTRPEIEFKHPAPKAGTITTSRTGRFWFSLVVQLEQSHSRYFKTFKPVYSPYSPLNQL